MYTGLLYTHDKRTSRLHTWFQTTAGCIHELNAGHIYVYKFRGKQPADGPLTTPPPSPGSWERKTTLPLHPSVRPPPCQSAGLADALVGVIIVCLSVLGAAGASDLCVSGSPPPRSPSSVWPSTSPAAISASGTSSPRGTRRLTSALSCMLISKLKSFWFRRWRSLAIWLYINFIYKI